MPGPFVRSYDHTKDFANGLHVVGTSKIGNLQLLIIKKFFETPESALNREPTRTIGSYLWYRAYVSLVPVTTCFVLDDGEGRAVGYCVGTSSTSDFVESWRKSFAPGLSPTEFPSPGMRTDDAGLENDESRNLRRAFHNAECSSLQAWPAELEKYPAHLHIDILEPFQRKGWGSVLINTLLDSVRRQGATGIHLDMVQWNTVGRNSYEKMGFERCSLVMDNGKSGETGVNGVVLTMVRAL